MPASESNPSAPQRTGAAFFVRVACHGLDRMAISDGMTIYRLTTSGGVFFFDADQFDVDSLQRRLKHNEQITIGAHRLRDGSAWLHWLERADGRLWATSPGRRRRWLAPVLLALCWVPVWLGLMLPGGFHVGWAMLRVTLFAAAAFALAWSLYRLMLECHPARRRVNAASRGLAQGKRPPLSTPPDLAPPADLALADGVHGDIGVVQGELSAVVVGLKTYGSGRYSYSLHEYHWRCGGGAFTLRTAAWDWRRAIDPILIRRPPVFIADGDRVTLLSAMADGEIRGLLNHRDGIAHVTHKGTPYTPMARRVMFWIASFMVVFLLFTMLSYELYSWYARGVGPDYWDWRDLLDLGGAVGLMLMIFTGALGVIGENVHRIYHQARKTPRIDKILGIAFQWRLRQRRSATLNEFY